MADVRKVVEKLTRNGIDLVDTGSLLTTNTYLIQSPGNVVLHFKKTGAGNCTVTFITQGTVDGQAIADRTVTVPATTGDIHVGPFPESAYSDSVGDLRFTLSEITGLTVAAMRIP
ncbi:hypothetical protein MYX75_01015 [Acidobacteria bacterium AH-259-A15]|nr:hypothetical protein [Acidobacteria bacterium AH-259-A15]